MDKIITGKQFDEERALYHLTDAEVTDCSFAGEKDGESALKEARNIIVKDCQFLLRYPLWHVNTFKAKNISMEETARAALWYTENGEIEYSRLHGIKPVRECKNIILRCCDVNAEEFGWKCENITLEHTSIHSSYLFLDSKEITLKDVNMSGKYSFQYVENMTITDSYLDTKDAFWHSKNVTVKNTTVKGEYLGWFSEGLTLIGCTIIGTQPLCYCKDLKLIDCTMEGCDLSFEYSEVEADIKGNVDSVKNPKSGMIISDAVGEVVREDAVMECNAKIMLRDGTIL